MKESANMGKIDKHQSEWEGLDDDDKYLVEEWINKWCGGANISDISYFGRIKIYDKMFYKRRD